MINYHAELVKALEKVLPTHYEMTLTADTETPCISYMELNNSSSTLGETMEYSNISYQVKVWDIDIAEIQKYALMVDDVLRPLGFRRTASIELYDRNSAMIQKVMTYEGLGKEDF